MPSQIIDITVPMQPGMLTYPGDPELTLTRIAEASADDPMSYSMTRVGLSTHCGTHVDAPAHFVAGGAGIDEVPLDLLCGPSRVLDVGPAGPSVDAAVLRDADLAGVTRLLLKTVSSGCFRPPFDADYAHLTPDGARYLRDQTEVALIGIDTLSIEASTTTDFIVHRTLLGETPPIIVIEGLDLSSVDRGEYHLCCLPLRLRGCDGGPARAFLSVEDA